MSEFTHQVNALKFGEPQFLLYRMVTTGLLIRVHPEGFIPLIGGIRNKSRKGMRCWRQYGALNLIRSKKKHLKINNTAIGTMRIERSLVDLCKVYPPCCACVCAPRICSSLDIWRRVSQTLHLLALWILMKTRPEVHGKWMSSISGNVEKEKQYIWKKTKQCIYSLYCFRFSWHSFRHQNLPLYAD